MAIDETVPAPFVFSPSQSWDGNDGSWSTFILRIGTPAQTYKLLPSTAGQEIFVPVPEGCTPNDPPTCGASRGAFPFQGLQTGFKYNESSTWRQIGIYDLILESQLNYTGNGLYGLDTVGLMVDGNATFQNQVVAGIATKAYYLGIFGLGPKPSNFSNFENPQPSLMQTMRNQKVIPSVSFAYTAGASYRQYHPCETKAHILTHIGIPKILGSLTLGGYDSSKFRSSSNASPFPFSADDSRVLSVGVQMITATGTLKGTVTLSSASNPVNVLIDSTVPHLWLPRVVCDAFEDAFGLTYDPFTDLYIFNDSAKHSQLLQDKPSVVIALGNDNDPSRLTQITLPFAAFDLEASYPIYPNTTSYFPIRRAANDSQYTLGRAFLQEAYVIADYERSNFSVYQVLSDSQAQEIVAIRPPSSTLIDTSPKADRSLGAGAIAGIVIGAVATVVLIGTLAWFFCCGKQRKASESDAGEDQMDENPVEYYQEDVKQESSSTKLGESHAELDSSGICLMSDDAQHRISDQNPAKFEEPHAELDSTRIYLMSDDAQRHEMPA
jgi:hypothetical protein